MKISLLALLLLPGTVLAQLKKELIIEMKEPASCRETLKRYAKEPLVFSCEGGRRGRVKFFTAGYTGKKKISLYMSELRKSKHIRSVTFDGVIEKLRENE